MKTIYIVGGDGFARECLYFLLGVAKKSGDIIFGGYLGHGGYGHTVNYKSQQYLYKGEVSEYKFSKDEYVIIGAGYPNLRKKIYDELKARSDVQFYNLIDIETQEHIPETLEMGEANIVLGRSSFTADIKVGNGNVFNGGVIVGHDSEIGDFNFFGPRAMVLGNVKIGNSNIIGANAILLPKSKIGNNNKIAPMSAVYKGCKNNCYMLGNPAMKEGVVED